MHTTFRPLPLLCIALSCLAACSEPPEVAPDAGSGCEPNCAPSPRDVASGQILRIRQENGLTQSEIRGALVTYVLPPDASRPDTHGFFLQATREGPALFVRVDPSRIEPAPKVGDEVALTVTEVLRQPTGHSEARSITGYTLLSEGNDVSSLVQDLTMEEGLLQSADTFDGELVRIDGELIHAWVAPGSYVILDPGLWFAALEAKGGYSNSKYVVVVPERVVSGTGEVAFCEFSLGAVPFIIGNQSAQLWALNEGDLAELKCPDAELTRALAVSSTTVQLRFDRPIDPATLPADEDGLTFEGGLSATGFAVEGSVVTVTTSEQVSRTPYKVKVGSAVRDVLGNPVRAPDTRDGFLGFFPRAELVLNELFCGGTGGRDLIELRAVTAGSTSDLTLSWTGPAPRELATFPDTEVEAGDLIVVHLMTNPLQGDSIYSETSAKDEFARAEYATNYDGAWDFVYEDSECEVTDGVMRVRHIDGRTMDGVALINSALPREERYASDWLRALQLEGAWLPRTCGGQRCGATTTPTLSEVSVDQRGVRTLMGVRQSVARTASEDTDYATDWGTVGPATIGTPNVTATAR